MDVGACTYIHWKVNSRKGRGGGGADLGFVIDTNLNFDKHIFSEINKANSNAGLIRRSFE